MWYLLLFALVDVVSGTCVVSPVLLEKDAYCTEQTGQYIQNSSPQACAEHCHSEGETGFFVTSHGTNTNACQCATDDNCKERRYIAGSNAYQINCIEDLDIEDLTPKPYTKVFSGFCHLDKQITLGSMTLGECHTACMEAGYHSFTRLTTDQICYCERGNAWGAFDWGTHRGHRYGQKDVRYRCGDGVQDVQLSATTLEEQDYGSKFISSSSEKYQAYCPAGKYHYSMTHCAQCPVGKYRPDEWRVTDGACDGTSCMLITESGANGYGTGVCAGECDGGSHPHTADEKSGQCNFPSHPNDATIDCFQRYSGGTGGTASWAPIPGCASTRAYPQLYDWDFCYDTALPEGNFDAHQCHDCEFASEPSADQKSCVGDPAEYTYVRRGICVDGVDKGRTYNLGILTYSGNNGDNPGSDDNVRINRCARACKYEKTGITYGPWRGDDPATGFSIDIGQGGRCYCNHLKHGDLSTCARTATNYKMYRFDVEAGCSPGQESDGSSCTDCAAGKVSSDVGCVLCSGYEYQDQVGQSTCKSCGANELSNGTSCHCIDGFGGSPCSACPAGKHSDDGECVSCGVGKYQDGSAQHECKDCASDSFVNEANTTCTICPYNNPPPHDWDVGCPEWSTHDGCHCDCGDSGFTGEHCDVCGYGMGFNANKCETCIEGRVNVENTHTAECAALGCDEGYGHTSDVTDRDWDNKAWVPGVNSTNSVNCQQCPPGTSSPANDGQCKAVTCDENEYVSNHVCTPCDSPKVNDAGDDASLGDTECDYPCAPDQYYFLSQDLSLRRCYACPVGTRSDGGETQCWEPVTDANIHDAVGESSHYYGDIEDLDTSAVTNMDGLFKNKDVPDISNWDVSSVTSMREMFMNATNIPDTSEWDVANVDTFWWKKDNFTCPYLTGAKVNGRCQFTNRGLRNTVLAWENDESGTEELYGPLATWDVSYVTNMTELFKDSAKNPDIRNWDMSNVVYADRMFQGSSFQHLIDNKDLSSLQTAENMFDSNYGGRVCGKHLARAGAKTNIDHHGANGKDNCIVDSNINTIVASWFVDPNTATYGHIDSWDVSEVTSMSSLFKNKTFGEETLKHWDTSNVENMASMFENTNFNKDIGHWDVRKVHTFNKMFRNNDVFAHDISRWEVFMHEPVEMTGGDYFLNNVLQLDALFKKEITDIKTVYNNWKSNPTAVEEEYGLISEWMTHSVVNMSGLFMGEDFNEDISHWVVSSVTDMSSMFENSAFNRPIGGWSTVNVRDMSKMFKDSDFNHEIKLWDVQKVEDMAEMFMGAKFSRSIGDWDLFATIADEVQAPGDEGVCGTMGTNLTLTSERVSQAAIRKCYEHCDKLDDLTRNDIEGRNRIRSWGRLQTEWTHFGIVTDELKEHTCRCMKETSACANSPHDYVYKFRDMVTTDIFKDNTAYMQPLCGLGWRYRILDSLTPVQRTAETSCGICNPGHHISECGLCQGEFQFDYCRDSPKTFTLQDLYDFGDSHGMTGLVVDGNGVPLTSDTDITNTGYVNKHACNCKYEGDLHGCLVVNGRKQVRLKEWYVGGERTFTDNGRYYCELDFLNGREVRPVSGFGSVACTDDVLLDREECGLVGGEWDGGCSMCLAPCADPKTGVKERSVDRVCTPCLDAETVFNNECVTCPDGKYTDANHAWCGKCPAGTHGEGGICYSCVDGMFAAFEGAIRCDTCAAATFSVGTECASCIDGYIPNDNRNGCKETNWCHRGTTAHGDHVGNYCKSCDDGFGLQSGTCVATCVHGEFVLGGDPDCVCHDMWSGTDCDTCSEDQFDFTYEIPPKCEDRPCSATLETDCLCVNEIVKDGRACIDFKIKEICEEGETDCMCDGEWTEEGICMGNEILLPCEGDFLHTREECFPGYRVNNFTCDTAPRPGGTCNGLCEESDYDSGEACCVPQPWLCENVCTDIEYSKIPQAGHIATSNDRGVCCTDRELCGQYKQCGDIDSSPKLNTNRDYFNTLRAVTTFDDAEFLETCCYSFEYTTANSWFGQGCGSNTIETAAECDTASGTWGSVSAGDWRGHCLTTTTMSGVSVPANRCRK